MQVHYSNRHVALASMCSKQDFLWIQYNYIVFAFVQPPYTFKLHTHDGSSTLMIMANFCVILCASKIQTAIQKLKYHLFFSQRLFGENFAA